MPEGEYFIFLSKKLSGSKNFGYADCLRWASGRDCSSSLPKTKPCKTPITRVER